MISLLKNYVLCAWQTVRKVLALRTKVEKKSFICCMFKVYYEKLIYYFSQN